MRVPHTISRNTLRAYTASDQTRMLLAERDRRLPAEDLVQWDERIPPSLADSCVLSVVHNFALHWELIHYLPQQDLDFLLEVLPVDLPLTLVGPIIEDGIYWERRCRARWPRTALDNTQHGSSWKRMFLELHLRAFLEGQEPGFIEPDEVMRELEVCGPYVVQLELKELLPSRETANEPVPPDECARGRPDPDHLDLCPVLTSLTNLRAFKLRYGVNNCGLAYKPSLFLISLNDVGNLARGIQNAACLTDFKVHRCNIDDVKLNILLERLVELKTLRKLEVTHCNVGDIGAKSVGKLLSVHGGIQKLTLKNNRIGCEGIKGIAYALQLEDSPCPLQVLDMEFNQLGDTGAIYLASMLLRNRSLEELGLGGTGIGTEGAKRLFAALLFNVGLHSLTLSNCRLGQACELDLLEAVHSNRQLEDVDVRRCGFNDITLAKVKKLLKRNRKALRRAAAATIEQP